MELMFYGGKQMMGELSDLLEVLSRAANGSRGGEGVLACVRKRGFCLEWVVAEPVPAEALEGGDVR